VDTSNGLAPPTDPFCSSGTSLSNNAISITGPGGNDSDTVSTSIASLAAPFSVSQHITIALAAGSALNTQTSTILTNIPEPASMMLLGSALLGLTVAFRKKLVKR
jgi:hypothetical protein